MGGRLEGTLRTEFDSRHNGLSTIRLVFASSVILWHSFPLTGHAIGYEPLRQVVGNFRADGFFAISGFLILASWERRPNVAGYVRARLLRILPAYWFNLLVVAFVVAPLAMWLGRGQVGALFSGPHSSWRYVLANLTTKLGFFDIAATPTGVPYPRAWNGSVWTLQWEMAAYAGLLVLAVLRLTRHRWVLLTMACAFWCIVLLSAVDVIHPGDYRLGGIRFALMFLTGTCLYAFADRIPMRGRLAAVAAVGVAFAGYLPDYRLVGAPALSYLIFWIASRLRHPRWHRRTDLSFGLFLFGFPVQQTLLVLGWPWLHPALFFVVSWLATAPLALICWFAVERPAMNWKRRLDGSASRRKVARAAIRPERVPEEEPSSPVRAP
jgi:peptidoglycan/LPS O-acetylase OafA/YrhL